MWVWDEWGKGGKVTHSDLATSDTREKGKTMRRGENSFGNRGGIGGGIPSFQANGWERGVQGESRVRE